MRAVIYTKDYEPITVVELSMWMHDMLSEGQRVVLAVWPKIYEFLREPCPSGFQATTMPTVTIWGEPIYTRRGKIAHMMIFTDDETNALPLDPVDLPGQIGPARQRERHAFLSGFLAALRQEGPDW